MSTHGITGVVLCGGLGRRMGGVDKGLVTLDGQALVEHVIARFAPQVDTLLLNANRHAERYATFGWPVVADALDGYLGPLAGLHAAMGHATTPLIASAPCDTPFLPHDLVSRLRAPLDADPSVEIAVARALGRVHPICSVARRTLRDSIDAALAAGERRVVAWQAARRTVHVDFDDMPTAFENLNTPGDVTTAERTSRG
ncbi:MAG: molybdenum cofactor guanylyltransferase [Burkholderiales bacterium]|jgi:molybdopterin-guanine dinucleotide biosynthesis protein A|nr:molybdenum cofactor guanylyltransferase [Burkholderiales bacterium]